MAAARLWQRRLTGRSAAAGPAELRRRASGTAAAAKPGGPEPAKPMSLAAADEYCASLVRSADYENYLTTLLLPDGQRRSMLAVRAFNAEVARIPDVARSTPLALARMKFWSDALDAVFKGTPPEHPVALALAASRQRQPISKGWLKRIVEEREARVSDPPFHSMAQVEAYADNTAGTLVQLGLQIARVPAGTADHAAAHVGRALGMVTLLRSIPYYLSKHKVMLPVQVLAKHGVVEEEVLRGQVTENLRDAVFEVATAANDHVLTARSLAASAPPQVRRVFAGLVPAAEYLRRLEAINFDALHPSLQHRSPRFYIKLAQTALTNKL